MHLDCVFDLRFTHQCTSYPGDLLFALGTVGSVSVVMALGAVDRPSLLEEAALLQDHLTLRTRKLLRVPGTAQRHQVPTPGTHTHTHRLAAHQRHY